MIPATDHFRPCRAGELASVGGSVSLAVLLVAGTAIVLHATATGVRRRAARHRHSIKRSGP